MPLPDLLTFPEEEVTCLFPGPAGALECKFTPCRNDHNSPRRAINAVVCHPHPLFDGTMHNKVVSMLAKACFETGIDSIRFNFRGVGKSEGQHSHAVGETADTLALCHHLKKIRPDDALILLGFSFGSCIAAKAALQIETHALVMVAPPVERELFQNLSLPECPVLLLQGDKDEVISFDAVQTFADSFRDRSTFQYEVFQDTGHFFHGKLLPLRETVMQFLKNKVGP